MNGIIIINKPSGWTSHDVIAKLRGATKQKRIGHGGTLDPMATGVLPVFVGRATRAAEFCENAEKEYIATLKLGIVTDTQDITGNILSENKVIATFEDLKNILPQFTGAQKQIPPMYSAIKKDGKKLYELARQGIEIPREPREIYISTLSVGVDAPGDPPPRHCGLEPQSPDTPDTYTLRITCSKGTYIRTLCHDIGAALGCGGTLSALERTRAGVYTKDKAHTLETVLAAISTDTVNSIILPIDSIFSEYPAIAISATQLRKALNGAPCKTQENTRNGRYRVYDPTCKFLLLGEVNNNVITTIKSFFEVKQK